MSHATDHHGLVRSYQMIYSR